MGVEILIERDQIDRLAEARAKQLQDYTPFNLAQRAKS
jgi:hypothetical protein